MDCRQCIYHSHERGRKWVSMFHAACWVSIRQAGAGFLLIEINFTFARMGIPFGEHSSLAKLRQGLPGQCWPARLARLTNLLPKAQSTANVLT